MSDDQYPPGQARDPADLLKNITDVNMPKSETEWAAHYEIERLRRELDEVTTERNRLRAAAEAAPHGSDCSAEWYSGVDPAMHRYRVRRSTFELRPEYCDCWKRAALGGG